MNIINVYEPEYVRRFQCNGGGCLCTCCIGKEIPLDKISSQAYLKSSDNDIRNIAQSSIELAKTDLENWGIIHLTSDNYCSFFDKSKSCAYCMIGGREDLHTRPKFCLDYPYVDMRWKTEIRKSLAIECPEACGQILMSPTSIWLESTKHISSGSSSPLDNVYQQINTECLSIALRPELTMSEKLFAIGQITLNNPPDGEDKKLSSKSMKLRLSAQLASLTTETIKAGIAKTPHDMARQWQLFSEIGSQVASLANVENVPAMESFWSDLHQDIYQSQNSGEQKIVMLDAAWNNFVVPVFDEFPHIVTNYLFYRIYHDAYPYHATTSSQECFYQLVADCFVLRNIISYWALFYSQIRKSKLVDIVNIYHRWRRQYPNSLNQSAQSLKDCGLFDPESINYLLIHNHPDNPEQK